MNNTQQINQLHNRINALTEQILDILTIKGNFASELFALYAERSNLEMKLGRLTRK
jgi:hypothetical protein